MRHVAYCYVLDSQNLKGLDIGSGGDDGHNAKELRLYVELGLASAKELKAATARAKNVPKFLSDMMSSVKAGLAKHHNGVS